MVRIGIVGLGFMGMIHFYAARKVRGAKVVAIATRNPKRRTGDWRDIRGNFGPRGRREDLSGLSRYAKMSELLDDPDVDLVDICLPTDLHHEAAIAALRAGKHVLVEKPITLRPAHADRMVRQAQKAGKLLMVAQVLPLLWEYDFAYKAIQSGRYGRLLAAHFKRIISPPTWSEAFADFSKTGGPGIDLHIHDTHFVALTCGMPRAVYARGRTKNGYAKHLTTQYLYDDPALSITCTSGDLCQPGREFTHGYEIYLEKATLLYEFAALGGQAVPVMPLTVLTADGKVQQPKPRSSVGGKGSGPENDPSIAAFSAEIRAAVQAAERGKEPPLLSGALARDALLLCHKEAESVRTGRVVPLR